MKPKKFTTPRGELFFPKIVSADTKFKTEGEYTANILLDPETEAFARFKEKLDTYWDEVGAPWVEEALESKKAAARTRLKEKMVFHPFFSPHLDKEGNETDLVIVKTKMTASGTTKAGKSWSRKPVIFDSLARPVKLKQDPWLGTTAKVSFAPLPFLMDATGMYGLSLRLEAVQIIQLVSGDSQNAEDYGFDEEEGDFQGYDSDEDVSDTDSDDVDTQGSVAEDDDDGDF